MLYSDLVVVAMISPVRVTKTEKQSLMTLPCSSLGNVSVNIAVNSGSLSKTIPIPPTTFWLTFDVIAAL